MTGHDGLRVLHVLDSFAPGGAQRVALDLATWSAAQGLDVTVAGVDGPLARGVDPRVRVVTWREASWPGEVARLLRLVRAVRPDVLHAHQRREALTCLVAGAPSGAVVVEHAHTWLPDGRGRLVAAASFRSRHVFAVSDQVARMVTDEFGRPAASVTTVGNTVVLGRDVPVVPGRHAPHGPWRLVGAGRLVDQKDPLRFVRVVRAAADLADVRATWFGDGPLAAAARSAAAELDAPVVFPGRVESVTEALDDGDALLMTSAWEGTPLVALEAFSRRRPVVATRACGSSGALGDGRAVLVDDDASDAEFAAALVGALSEQEASRTRVARAGEYIDTLATPEAVFGPVLDRYRDLVGAQAVRAGAADTHRRRP